MKSVLISGATKGIGKAIALEFAKLPNTHLILNYSNDDLAANETIEEIKKLGGSAELLKCKVQDYSSVNLAITEWKKNNPDKYIHTLINNAGVLKDGLMMFMEEGDWDDVVDIKLKGFYNLSRAVIQEMLLKRSGRIINIASYSGVYGMAGQVNYSAANGGLIAAAKALAKEVGKRNITVNVISPGYIKTEMTESMNEAEWKKVIPAQRFGKAEEVAHLVLFLASDKAAYINGENININGGL